VALLNLIRPIESQSAPQFRALLGSGDVCREGKAPSVLLQGGRFRVERRRPCQPLLSRLVHPKRETLNLKIFLQSPRPSTLQPKPITPKFNPRNQNPKHQTPNSKHQTPIFNPQTSNLKPQTPSLKHQTPSTKHQTPDTKPQTQNPEP